jgi:hypothetical protein
MTRRWTVMIALATILVAGGSSAEDVQWVRVTVLLERGTGQAQQFAESLIRGGIYSMAEVERSGVNAIDAQIVERVSFLSAEMDDLDESMRLRNLLSRQYYLPLRLGEQAVVPVIDLNPRLGVVLDPQRFDGDRVICRVRFFEPEGPPGAIEYTGEPIDLMLKDADIKDVIGTFSAVTGREIVVDDSVSGNVTVDLRDMPWDQAFDVVLRTRNLGSLAEGDTLRVAPLDELSRRRRIRTEATVNLPRGSSGAATIASRGDAVNRAVVLVIESVADEPDLVAERDGLLRPPVIHINHRPSMDPSSAAGSLLIFRGTATEDGELKDVEILASPFPDGSDDLLEVFGQVRPWTVLDEQVRRIEAVVGYGLRVSTSPAAPQTLVPVEAIRSVGVEVEVSAPSQQSAETDPAHYVVSVILRDLGTEEVLSAPQIPVRNGEEGTLRAIIHHPDAEPSAFKMKVKITKDGRRVSYSWTITSSGRVTSSHKANIVM